MRVQAKLKAIGISDIDTLIKMVDKNTINEELYNRGYVPLSLEALDSIRKQKTFMQALDSVDVPNIRQVGIFDPVAQMLSRRSIGGGARGRNSSKKGAEETSSPKTRLLRRPAIIQEEMDLREDSRIPPRPRLRGVHGRDRPKKNSSASPGFMLPPMHSGGSPMSRSYSEGSGFRPPPLSASHAHTLPPGRLDRFESDPSGEASRSSKRLANTMSLGDGFGTATHSRAESYRLTAAPSVDELMALQRAGQRMLHSLEDPQCSAAKWSPKSWKTPLEQGEDMLLEQGALDAREQLVRVVKSKSLPPDPFRSHIALNIKQRMAECATNDSKEGLAINQRCLNIRKQLAGMVNARKELASLRAKVHLLMEEPILLRLILDGFTDHLHDMVQESRMEGR